MSGKRYTDDFKIEAVRQVTDRGYPLGGSTPKADMALELNLEPPSQGTVRPDILDGVIFLRMLRSYRGGD
jgi:hypothetical protein